MRTYPRTLRTLRTICNLTATEAAACIAAHLRGDAWSGEAVNVAGGVRSCLAHAFERRHLI